MAQKALGTINALTGKRDPFMGGVFAGLHNTRAGAVTNVLQISVNNLNTRLMAVGNFTTVGGLNRHQIVQFDITAPPRRSCRPGRRTCSPRRVRRASRPT